MQKTKFKLNDNEYRIIVQTRRTIAAVRDMTYCCLEAVFITDGVNPVPIKGAYESVLKIIVNRISNVAIAETLAFENDKSLKPAVIKLPGNKQYDAMKPTEVPGTSGGAVYNVVLTTHEGVVSYKASEGSIAATKGKCPRIRTVKSNNNKSWSVTKVNDAGMDFGTVENTHMSSTGKNAEETAALIKRGLDALLRLGIDF
jgi:hypothetical protein